MKLTLMETAQQLVAELSELTGISLESIKKDDETVLALFQTGTPVNKNTGLDMIPMFETGFAKRTLAAVQPESYEDVRKIRTFVNDGSPWAHTTLDMLENGLITLKSVLADQEDLREFAEENGISEEDLKNTITDRNVMSREVAEQFADITWKLAFFKIHCEELYYITYKERMAEFYF
jgi:DNA polymerase III alpha subunit (gram-positive type)